MSAYTSWRRTALAILTLLLPVWTPCTAQAPLPELTPDLVDPGSLAGRQDVLVQGFRFRGNTVFDDAALAARLEAYVGRRLDSR